MTIFAHTLVKNEENYLWFAVTSVIDYVDKMLLWDTGSSDSTPKIIAELKKLYPGKISEKYLDEVDIYQYSQRRKEMLEATNADWFLMLDGDEVWWENSIKKVVEFIRLYGENNESIVVPNINLVGDIFHFMEKEAGKYNLAGKKGHFALRAVNTRIPGLSIDKPHGTSGWIDGAGLMIQDRDPKKIKFIDAPYLHFSFLKRTKDVENARNVPKREMKLKYEIGENFPLDFYYPEVFFKPRLDLVPNPWVRMNAEYASAAAIQTIPKKLKRRLFKGKVGY